MQSKNSILVALAVLFLFVSDSTAQERVPMTNARMDELLRAEDKTGGDEMPGSSDEEKLPPVMVVLTDDRADRMRLMMPIRKFDHSKSTDLKLALIALHSNYDRALDARCTLVSIHSSAAVAHRWGP